jgi:two-component sensor histidine kinase
LTTNRTTEPTAVGPKAETAFTLIFHELATNAVKYGALSDVDGELNVECHVDATRWLLRGAKPILTWMRTILTTTAQTQQDLARRGLS